VPKDQIRIIKMAVVIAFCSVPPYTLVLSAYSIALLDIHFSSSLKLKRERTLRNRFSAD
jgi:hypothetical protein